MDEFEFAVVGKGLFGSAAARHLSARSDSVVLIGPDEPTDRRTHEGVFASHYDQGRLIGRIAANRLWSEMTARTFDAISTLEDLTGTTILRPVGALHIGGQGVTPRRNRQQPDGVPGGPLDWSEYAAGDDSWRPRFPQFDFPSTSTVFYEAPPAGVLDPRALVACQIAGAVENGSTVISEVATGAGDVGGRVRVDLETGGSILANRVLVAAGSFSNHFGLINAHLDLRVETEIIMLATVSDVDGLRLGGLPTVHYTIDDPNIADIYMTPPLVYPDGRWKLKMGCNTSADLFPETLGEIKQWFRSGDTDVVADSMRSAIISMLPAVDFESFETAPCIITKTESEHPMIDQVGDATFVAAAGNGSGAKSSDGWGSLAAALMLGDQWPEWVDASLLKARSARST